MAKANTPPETEPLVNETIPEVSSDQFIEQLKAQIEELEGKLFRVIEKKDAAEKRNTALKEDNESLTKKAAAHGQTAKKMRIFCELLNGNASRLLPANASNPNGVKNNTEVIALVAHFMGLSEVIVKQIDERF